MNPKDLIKILESKLIETPTDEDLKERLAFLLLSQGELNRAESLFDEVVQSNPQAQNSIWGLAKLSWQKKSYDVAYSYMNLLASFSDSTLNKEQSLIFAKILAKKHNFYEASKWLDSAISQDSSLLLSELPFLKLIKHNLNPKGSLDKKKLEEQIQNNLVSNNQLGKNAHYIILEISQLLDVARRQTDNINVLPNDFVEDSTKVNEDSDNDAKDIGSNTKEDADSDIPNQLKKFVTFDQIGGLKTVKQALVQEILLPLKNPQLCAAYTKSTNPRVLLYGPSGCGKTHLCRALAAEAEIPFFSIRPSDFLDLTYEESEIRLIQLFQKVREVRPAIILFDDIDWLAELEHKSSISRGLEDVDTTSKTYRSNILNTILEFISVQFKDNSQIGIIATTNKPWNLDYEFFTSSKINKHIYVYPPNKEEKIEILKAAIELRQNPVIMSSNINFEDVIDSLPSLASGADIENVVDSSLTSLLIETMVNIQLSTEAEIKLDFLRTEHLIKASKQLNTINSVGLWIKTAKDKLSSKEHSFYSFWLSIRDNSRLIDRANKKSIAETLSNVIRFLKQKIGEYTVNKFKRDSNSK